MGFEKDDPPRLEDPEDIERARQSLRRIEDVRRRALRWTYAVLTVLVIVVIVLAYTR